MFNSGRWRACVLAGALIIPVFSAHADEVTSWDDVRSAVQTMLYSETKIAMSEQQERERKALGQPSVLQGLAAVPVEPIATERKPEAETETPKPTVREVVGIWGLGDNLLADVRIDGKTLRFQRGSRYAQGYGPGSLYTLVSIQTPCVTYSEKGVPHKVCINNTNPEPAN